MNNYIFVEDKDVYLRIEPMIPKEFKLLTISDIVKKKNNNIVSILSKDDLEILKELIEESESIHFVFTENFFLLEDCYAWIFENLNIQSFFKVTLDNLEKKNIQLSFDASIEVDKDEINYVVARNKIDRIISNEVTKVIRWFLIKEDFIDEKEASEMILSRSILYALVVIVLNQDKIDNFLPDFYDKIAIDYNFNGIQFRVKSNKKFKADKQEELISLFNILSAKNNDHMIKKFERGIKDIPAVEPLTKHSLQKSCSFVFGYSPRETLKIAKELFDGIEIEGEKTSLITSFNTNSKRIDSEKRMQISNFIENNFGREYFFNGTRERKKSDDYETREAIVPTQISDLTTPEKLKRYLSEEQFRIYNYIFWRTISSEMVNAAKDATVIVMNIEGEVLKAESNKILQHGWLIAGGYWEHDIQLPEEEIELPLDLYAGMNLKEYKIDTVIYKVFERTPMRYSTGRFFDKASKDLLADEQEVTTLIDILIEAKLILLEVKNMIKPTQRAVRLYYVLKEFASQLVDEAFITETFQALKNIKDGKLEKNVLIDAYYKQLSLLRDSLGYTQNDEEIPDTWKINEAKKIAKQKGQQLPDMVLNNKTLLDNYLKSNVDSVEKLGICPSCKTGEIFEQNKAYACNNTSCKLILWKSNIHRFYSNFGKDFEETTIKEQLKLILSKGFVKIENFFYKESFFDKNIVIEFNEKFKNWGFSFESKKKSIELLQEELKDLEIVKTQESIEELNIVRTDEINDEDSIQKDEILNFNNLVVISYENPDDLKNIENIELNFLQKYKKVLSEQKINLYYFADEGLAEKKIKNNISSVFRNYKLEFNKLENSNS